MIEAVFVFAYMAVVLYVGLFAFRRAKSTGEDYFLASRSIGGVVFLLSLFGTHMTAFAILGSSGRAFREGIGVYGLMASSSALVVPLLLLFLGTRLWAAGRRFGHMTPVQIFRDRWEAGHTGTVLFVLQACLLVPYIVIGVMGGGTTLAALTGGAVPEWLGGGIVALVVMSYVFFGGMRGTAWVNALQTVLFLTFGAVACIVIAKGLGGFDRAVEALLADPAKAHLLTREKVSPLVFLSFTFIPLSAIAFPHMTIFCLTARRVESFRRTVVLYPVCILLVWLPCVFLGALAAGDPEISAAASASGTSDQVMLLLLKKHAPPWLAGLLGAGIMAAVMASDSQILALSTMFTEDIFAYYGGKEAFGERVQVITGRAFVVGVTVAAYAIAMTTTQQIFDIAVKYAFTGYAALSPIVAGVFWRRSTRRGVLASALVVAAGLAATAWLEAAYPAPGALWELGGVPVLSRTPGGLSILGGLLPVVPLVLASAAALAGVSLVTRPPSQATIERYIP
ncbi:MAG: sodium:solute symporter family protein [Planctomycetes bacterium]|nr:sodium:solute symporter family protein [Planctomycetota bacterium]